MPDSNIGSLPQVPNLNDESLMVVEQQGQAMKMTGAQFKDFGRQSVVAEVQEYVDEAQQAAEDAVKAVQSVAGMTVSAHDLEHGEAATVTKTIQNDVFHLDFGLPQGKQGIPGPEGKEGPRGPKGEMGSGLKILGYYDTPEQLEAAQPLPEPGEAYGVGTEPPYDVYVFDGVTGKWKNNGPLSGGGSILPEDVVTSPGGASVEVAESLGESPHVIVFTDEEEPPLTAEDIQYGNETVGDALEELFTSVSNGKALVASAITDKGVPTAQDAAFAVMAENIGKISTGASTEDATATPGDILAPKTAYTAAGKVEGLIPTLAARTITPGTAAQTIGAGQYLGGTQTILGDTNLTSANIKSGVSIFGVEGAMEQSFLATLTVTVDIGAVVTAKNGDTEVSALSTTGAVTLELPIEGQWTVTARRGVAQYNSVVINVSSRYSASLTAEVHLVYYGKIETIGYYTGKGATSLKNYALFGYGAYQCLIVNAFDEYLVKTQTQDTDTSQRDKPTAAAIGDYALFAGGHYKAIGSQGAVYKLVDAYTTELIKTVADPLSKARYGMGAASIGSYALLGGGYTDYNGTVPTNAVDAYDASLVHTIPTVLALAENGVKAAANQNYAMFCGTKFTAYNAELTRHTAADPEETPTAAARAGNYVVFAGKTSVSAYDLFLTRTLPEPLQNTKKVATTLQNLAIFGGGTTAEVYDSFLVRTVVTAEASVGDDCAASAGNYALFAGGTSGEVSAYQYV